MDKKEIVFSLATQYMITKISIIIPVFQAEKYLSNCLNSILKQTYTNYEIIAINDGSTDNSLNILNEFALQDSRIKIISQKNKGLVASRRRGLIEANNEFIFFIDADDTIPHNALEILVKNHTYNDDIICGNMNVCTENGKILRTYLNNIPKDRSKIEIMFALLTKRITTSLCGKIIRKQLLLSVSTNLKYTIGEDVVTNMLILDKFDIKMNFVNEISYNYIQHEGSMLNSIGHLTANKRLEYIEKVYNISLKYTYDYRINNALSYFILEEFYSFIRDGGKLSDNENFTKIIYNQAIKNQWAKSHLASWRISLISLYKLCPILGKIMRNILLFLRKMKYQ